MIEVAVDRLEHIKERIDLIRALLHGKVPEDLRGDATVRAAFERHIEVISEASRKLPKEWKDDAIPWQRIADIGNVLRHAYPIVDHSKLWSIYESDLDRLEQAIDTLLQEHRG